ncbi:ArsR/SmtB family transcription factor [Kribbella sp. CA-247076]|uniref:ArsR/SmtB family transcription factor n=1 Tax=Kribbella sp. CA-247076 TaxID=3239941 RepID=UPI003D8ADC77
MSTEAGRDPFAALGDPMRRRILELLADGSRSVGELAGELPVSRPAVSRHLRLLKEAGLVDEVADGTRRIYHLQESGAEAVQAYLLQVWGEAVGRFKLLAENTRPPGEGP